MSDRAKIMQYIYEVRMNQKFEKKGILKMFNNLLNQVNHH